MPEMPAARQRLAELMDARRLELGLRWQDVAAAGDVSIKTLYSVRTGHSAVPRLTARKVDKGLHWEPGSVERVLAGGDPQPLAGPALVPARPLPADDPEIAALIRDWPELETIWALATADGKPYPREERIRLMKAHIDTIRRKVRELEIRAERALRTRPVT